MPFKGGLILSLLFLAITSVGASQQVSNRVIIVKSSDNTYFDQTIATLINHVDQSIRFKVVRPPDVNPDSNAQVSGDLFIALGPSAAKAVNRLNTETSSINAYLTLEQYRALEIDGQLTILLDQPLHRYLAFCKLILGVNSIGVLEENEIDLSQKQARTLDEYKLSLNQYRVDQVNKLQPVLRDLLQQNDALLMLPRQSIYNRETVKGVLLSSYRNRKPAVSYSPAHVKTGAVASIFSSPVHIGRHLALLVNQELKNQPRASSRIQFAKFYTIATNSRVASALGINLPEEQKLRSKLDGFHQ